jgi:hypothetical protein
MRVNLSRWLTICELSPDYSLGLVAGEFTRYSCNSAKHSMCALQSLML